MYGVNPCCQRDCNSLKSLKYSNNDLHCTLHIVENLVVEFWARIAKQTNKCQGTLKKCSYINCPHWLLMTEKSQLIRNFPNIRCKKLLVYVLTYFLRQQQVQRHRYFFFQSVRYAWRKNCLILWLMDSLPSAEAIGHNKAFRILKHNFLHVIWVLLPFANKQHSTASFPMYFWLTMETLKL